MAGPASFLIELYQRHHAAAPSRVVRAPGRVNLIGEHTDYNLGFVLPVAIELSCFIAAGPRNDGILRVHSEDLAEHREWPIDTIAGLEPAGDWSDYVVGVAQGLMEAGFDIRPQNLVIHSTLPSGSGLSSSAALEVASALALLDGREMDRLQLAQLCHAAENRFVGLPCGIMDQFVSVYGQEGAAVGIDCRSLEHQAIELPPNIEILAVNTMVKHELGQSEYRRRVEECMDAVAAVQPLYPLVESLRDVTVAMLNHAAEAMPDAAYRRARHVITENERVNLFVGAAGRHDIDGMGRLLVASHRSLQSDYEVSCQELDFLVDTAIEVPGVYGARMTGGGFGGCTVNLVHPAAVSDVKTYLTSAYESRFSMTPQVYRCRPAAGAEEIFGQSVDSRIFRH